MNVNVKHFTTGIGEVTYVTLTNACGAQATLSSLGAAIVALRVPDSKGNVDDVVMGYDSPTGYLSDDRFGGGVRRIWQVTDIGADEVCFAIAVEDGCHIKATYRWTDDNVLELYLEADYAVTSIADLISRTYFDLDRHSSDAATDRYLWLNASRYIPLGDKSLGAHYAASVVGTPIDFTTARLLGRDAELSSLALSRGIDYVINDWIEGVMNEAAVLASHGSGRQLSVFTTLPVVNVAIGNCRGISIACQGLPEAWRHSDAPSQTLRQGVQYNELIFFKFATF